MNAWLSLSLAMLAEVIATSALKASEGFTHPLPSVIVVAGIVTGVLVLHLFSKSSAHG